MPLLPTRDGERRNGGHRGWESLRGTREVVPSGLSSPAGSTQSPGCHVGQKCLCTPLNRALPAKLPPPRSPTCPLAGRKTRAVARAPAQAAGRAGRAGRPGQRWRQAAGSTHTPSPGRARGLSRLSLEQFLLSLAYGASKLLPLNKTPQPWGRDLPKGLSGTRAPFSHLQW